MEYQYAISFFVRKFDSLGGFGVNPNQPVAVYMKLLVSIFYKRISSFVAAGTDLLAPAVPITKKQISTYDKSCEDKAMPLRP